jgi:hypothetical protein
MPRNAAIQALLSGNSHLIVGEGIPGSYIEFSRPLQFMACHTFAMEAGGFRIFLAFQDYLARSICQRCDGHLSGAQKGACTPNWPCRAILNSENRLNLGEASVARPVRRQPVKQTRREASPRAARPVGLLGQLRVLDELTAYSPALPGLMA